MATARTTMIDVKDMITRGALEARLQPIPSIRRRGLIGVEALSRGFGPDGALVIPDVLFPAAEEQGLAAELDYACHQHAMERFLPLLTLQPDLVLFINVAPGTFEHSHEGVNTVSRLASTYGIDPRNIAIEIPEREIVNEAVLTQAVQDYNNAGFLVALDDIGVKHSNLDRIVAIHPDILKVDRSLLLNIESDSYKQEIFKALVSFSERIGGWVIAEGIEDEQAAVKALELGGDIMQGYFFGRPGPFDAQEHERTLGSIEQVAEMFKTHATRRFHAQAKVREARRLAVLTATQHIQTASAEAFDDVLHQLIRQFPTMQSACVLDQAGIQISATAWRTDNTLPQKTIIFHPPDRGTDHSFKEYFYLLAQTEAPLFETTPYVPLPTQALCVTLSTFFHDADQSQRVLCIHMDGED